MMETYPTALKIVNIFSNLDIFTPGTREEDKNISKGVTSAVKILTISSVAIQRWAMAVKEIQASLHAEAKSA
jgi:hypothetical protein